MEGVSPSSRFDSIQRWTFQILLVLILSLLSSWLTPISQTIRTHAALPAAVSDTLTDSRKAVPSRQTILLGLSAGTSFDAGETIILNLPAGFTIPAFTSSDLSFNDGVPRNLLTSCVAGNDNIGYAIVGQTITFTACGSFVSAGVGAVINIVLGTGSTLITNNVNSGVYIVNVTGSYGDDPQIAALAITTGVTFSVTVSNGLTGNVRFIGDAFPNALVYFYVDSVLSGTSLANSSSLFDKTLSGITSGIHTFGIFGEAGDGRRTLMISFNLNVIGGSTLTVSGILLPPIVSAPATELRPKQLNESGLARQNSLVTTFTDNRGPTITDQTDSNSAGNWSLNLADVLHLGAHTVTGLVSDGLGGNSILSSIQTVNIQLSADLNVDNRVNLTDFSILMFNYGLADPPNLAADINDEGHTDLVDFSIMMFYWTN